MATNRKLVFANDQIYHVFNRGVERRPTFTNKRELQRALDTLKYYQYSKLPFKLSRFLLLEENKKQEVLFSLKDKQIEILAYCLMPNHFHFLLKQNQENGISNFVSNFTNSYTKFFNTRNERIGPLFQGRFKAVIVESDEQLIHLSRYIHLNPVTAFLMKPENLADYSWSSFPEFINLSSENITNKNIILEFFPSVSKYKQFVIDQVDYAKQLEVIKHLVFE